MLPTSLFVSANKLWERIKDVVAHQAVPAPRKRSILPNGLFGDPSSCHALWQWLGLKLIVSSPHQSVRVAYFREQFCIFINMKFSVILECWPIIIVIIVFVVQRSRLRKGWLILLFFSKHYVWNGSDKFLWALHCFSWVVFYIFRELIELLNLIFCSL